MLYLAYDADAAHLAGALGTQDQDDKADQRELIVALENLLARLKDLNDFMVNYHVARTAADTERKYSEMG